MGKRILKIDLEMAEKIKVKDGNPNFNFFVTVKKYFFINGAISCLRNTNIIKVGGVSENSDGHKNFED